MKPRCVSESLALQLVVADLDDHSGLNRGPGKVFSAGPSALATRHPCFLTKTVIGDQLTESLEYLETIGVRETGAMADEVKVPGLVVKTKEKRPDLAAIFVVAESAHNHVNGSTMFDLDHRPFAVLISKAGFLGDDPVATCRLEIVKPLLCLGFVVRLRREMPWVGKIMCESHQSSPPHGEWGATEVLTAICQ